MTCAKRLTNQHFRQEKSHNFQSIMETSSTKNLTSRQDCVEAVQALVDAARMRVMLFTQQLEPLLYNHHPVCERLSLLVRKNRHARVRILAQQTRTAAEGHCLINLAQQLSSFVQIRIPVTPELQNYQKSLLIVDDHSLMLIDNPERYEGSLIENNRLHVKPELEFFDHAWENSEPDQNTRRLNI